MNVGVVLIQTKIIGDEERGEDGGLDEHICDNNIHDDDVDNVNDDNDDIGNVNDGNDDIDKNNKDDNGDQVRKGQLATGGLCG